MPGKVRGERSSVHVGYRSSRKALVGKDTANPGTGCRALSILKVLPDLYIRLRVMYIVPWPTIRIGRLRLTRRVEVTVDSATYTWFERASAAIG